MNNYEELTENVIEFVAKQVGVKQEKLFLDTRISHDLGVAGDDAYDFILAFSKKYEVDLSDFIFDQYFASEGTGCFPIIYLYWLIFNRGKFKIRSLTIKDLVNSALLKNGKFH